MDNYLLTRYRNIAVSAVRTAGIEALVWETKGQTYMVQNKGQVLLEDPDHRFAGIARALFRIYEQSGPVTPGERDCRTCRYCGMDMDMEPYCVHPKVLERAPHGQTLSSLDAPTRPGRECEGNKLWAAKEPVLPEVQLKGYRGVVFGVKDVRLLVLCERGHPVVKSFQRIVRQLSKKLSAIPPAPSTASTPRPGEDTV